MGPHWGPLPHTGISHLLAAIPPTTSLAPRDLPKTIFFGPKLLIFRSFWAPQTTDILLDFFLLYERLKNINKAINTILTPVNYKDLRFERVFKAARG